ncbi:MAG: FAD-dependent oxidoreductase [Myxococcales bacterium]|nr:FAD-dependent oxidoreductase [Myxococcales bacterium]
MNDPEFIVVGAGLAGLAAARALTAAGRQALVLEARDRVGGRLLNHTWSDGHVGELGGQWIGPTQDHALRLVRELGLELYPSYETGTHLAYRRGRLRRFRGETFGLPPWGLLDGLVAQRRLEAMARAVPLEAPWSAPRARAWDGQTLESWLRRHMRTRVGYEFFRAVCTAIFCAEAEDVSLLHFLFYVRSGRSLDQLLRLRGGAQESRVVGGSQRIALALAEQLGERVITGAAVDAIEQGEDGVVARCTGGAVHRAARVIVTLPPPLAARIRYSPALPGLRDQLTQKLAMGSVIKCMARYPQPFWRDAGLSGFAISVERPVNVIFDNSPHGGGCGVLLGFIEGREARALGELAPADRRALVLENFASYFGERARAPLEYEDKDWSQDPWTRGCYGAHFAPGVWTQFGAALRRPCGRVHWAGAETAAVWSGYMDGALRSGERAAQEVLA